MSSIHVIEGSNNVYRVVVHATTPAGNNAAGTPWATAIKNAGRAKTVMQIGSGAGQILQSEANEITNGAIMEGVFRWEDNPAWTNAERIADIDLRAQQLIADMQSRYQDELKFFGYTRG
jgi:hypothetical protein